MDMEEKKKTSKSEKTKESILAAATRLFSKRGYENTSIRDVASEAGIDPALVIRYFKNKDGLFSKAAHFDLRLNSISGTGGTQLGGRILKHFLNVWENEEASIGMQVLLRSAASNQDAAHKLKALFQEQVFPFVVGISGRAGAEKKAGLIATQLLGLAMCRYIFKLPPVMKLTQEDLVLSIGGTIQTYLK